MKEKTKAIKKRKKAQKKISNSNKVTINNTCIFNSLLKLEREKISEAKYFSTFILLLSDAII
jgi:hypothetical protein